MLRNIGAKVKFLQTLANAAMTADVNSTGFDCKDFGAVGHMLSVGNFSFTGTNKVTIKMQYSDDNSTFVDVPAAEMYSSADQKEGTTDGVCKILDASGDENKVYFFEYRGSKRYSRLAFVVGGTVSVGASVATMGSHSEFMPAL